MRLIGLLFIAASFTSLAEAQDVVCSEKMKRVITIDEGDSFSFKTQAGAKYLAETKCQVTYKKGSTCLSIQFSCSEFDVNSKEKSCKGGDKMMVIADGKNTKFCQTSSPDVTTSGNLKVLFTSNKKTQSTGAVCTVQCAGDSSPTTLPTATLPTTTLAAATGTNVPGTKGAPWTAETVDIVKQKLTWLLKKDGTIFKQIVPEPSFREKYFYESPNYPLPSASMGFSETTLRLAFHGCLKYSDGTGGCNGCLDLDKYFLYSNAEVPVGHNNGLNWAVAVLEAVYEDKDFPSSTGVSGTKRVPNLDVSLVDLGASRADLWAFAGMVAVEHFILQNHADCEAGKNGEYTTWCEGSVNGNWTGCEFDLAATKANMKFETGRSDCVTSRKPAYLPEPGVDEIHADVKGNGTDTTKFFREQFNFTMRETVAIMGAHTIGQVHQEVSLLPYSWTREGRQVFNNEYYKIMAQRKMYAMTACVGNAQSQPGEGDFLTALEGKKSLLDPMNVTELTGKMVWFHTYLRCPDCKGLAAGKFEDFENRYDAVGGIDFCCGKDPEHPIPDGLECQPQCVIPMRRDEAFTNSEMGLMLDFSFDEETGKFQGCPGYDNAEDSQFEVGKVLHPQCPYNKMITEEGTPIHTYVEEYADDQDLWAVHFGATFKKMLSNGYGDTGHLDALVPGPDY